METLELESFLSFTLAIVLLFLGKLALQKSELLRRYSIPEPVIGGFLCAFSVAVIYFVFDLQITFSLEVRDWLLLYFFAAMGLNADIKTLIQGGKPLLILTLLAGIYIMMQNSIGMGVAAAFGMDPKAGLMSGSIPLIGGIGTTLAWAPKFVEDLGINNAMEIGVASSTVGLIGACVIGGPIASFLIKKHKLQTSDTGNLDIGQKHGELHQMVDKYSILFGWLALNLSLMLGYGINELLQEMGIELPMFVACLMGGILLGNVTTRLMPNLDVAGSRQGLALISDICLGMFLVMALMDLKVWELGGVLGYLTVVMTLQVILSVGFAIFVVFRAMGRDYEAAVICSGFGGISLGSTATAIANMTAVTQQYGAAHRAFIVVPLVCGFFIDLINAMAIGFFINL